MEVRVSHGAPRRGASDDPSGASAGRPAPLTRTVGPHPPRPEPVGVGGEVGYLASTLHALPSTRFRWVSDRKNAVSKSKGPSVSKKAEKASLLKRAGRAPPPARHCMAYLRRRHRIAWNSARRFTLGSNFVGHAIEGVPTPSFQHHHHGMMSV